MAVSFLERPGPVPYNCAPAVPDESSSPVFPVIRASRQVLPFPAELLRGVSDPLMRQVRTSFEGGYLARFGKARGPGLYGENDWRRLDWAARKVPQSGSILDVGCGPGAFLNYLTLSGRHDQVTGIDIRQHTRFHQVDEAVPLDLREMSVAGMKFPDKSFDTVVCMEVLEHLHPPLLEPALSELNRVCRGSLLLSVPFEEPEPLPSYHRMRFDRNDIARLFPGADVTLLLRVRRRPPPWAMILLKAA